MPVILAFATQSRNCFDVTGILVWCQENQNESIFELKVSKLKLFPKEKKRFTFFHYFSCHLQLWTVLWPVGLDFESEKSDLSTII